MLRILAFIGFILYLLSPIDIIPDFLGLPGRLDDIALLIYLIYWSKKQKKNQEAESTSSATNNQKYEKHSKNPNTGTYISPRTVLGVGPEADREEIEKAYRKLASQYHPDKVEHLGEELQKVAREKMIDLTKAYEQLCPKK